MKRKPPKIVFMPCGKHKGKPVHLLPSSYLHWAAENFDDDMIATAADTEWQWREKSGEHKED